MIGSLCLRTPYACQRRDGFRSRQSFNWDVEQDIKKSPLCAIAYLGIWRCPRQVENQTRFGPLKGGNAARAQHVDELLGGRLGWEGCP